MGDNWKKWKWKQKPSSKRPRLRLRPSSPPSSLFVGQLCLGRVCCRRERLRLLQQKEEGRVRRRRQRLPDELIWEGGGADADAESARHDLVGGERPGCTTLIPIGSDSLAPMFDSPAPISKSPPALTHAATFSCVRICARTPMTARRVSSNFSVGGEVAAEVEVGADADGALQVVVSPS